jgi:hypothetical protein
VETLWKRGNCLQTVLQLSHLGGLYSGRSSLGERTDRFSTNYVEANFVLHSLHDLVSALPEKHYWTVIWCGVRESGGVAIKPHRILSPRSICNYLNLRGSHAVVV